MAPWLFSEHYSYGVFAADSVNRLYDSNEEEATQIITKNITKGEEEPIFSDLRKGFSARCPWRGSGPGLSRRSGVRG